MKARCTPWSSCGQPVLATVVGHTLNACCGGSGDMTKDKLQLTAAKLPAYRLFGKQGLKAVDCIPQTNPPVEPLSHVTCAFGAQLDSLATPCRVCLGASGKPARVELPVNRQWWAILVCQWQLAAAVFRLNTIEPLHATVTTRLPRAATRSTAAKK